MALVVCVDTVRKAPAAAAAYMCESCWLWPRTMYVSLNKLTSLRVVSFF